MTKATIERESPRIALLLGHVKQIRPELAGINAAELLTGKLTPSRVRLLTALEASAIRLSKLFPEWAETARVIRSVAGERSSKPAPGFEREGSVLRDYETK